MNKKPLIILGSARKDGNTYRAVNTVFTRTEDCTLCDLLDFQIKPYSYTEEHLDDFLKIVDLMLAHPTLVFATPVYWYAMSTALKTFFDRLTELITQRKELGRALARKRVFLIATGTSTELPEGFEVPFQKTSEYLSMEYVQGIYFMVKGDSVLKTSADIQQFRTKILHSDGPTPLNTNPELVDSSDNKAPLRKDEPRPDFIKHYSEIQEPDNSCYKTSNSDELLSIGSPFGRTFGFKRLGIHHEVLPPGRRTSWPHAEKTEEEFVYVIEGSPDVWIDGEVVRLSPGDGVGFVPGTGISHTFINNTEKIVRLLVVGDTKREDNKVFYPLHPDRNKLIGDQCWNDIPKRQLGPHDGLPDSQRG